MYNYSDKILTFIRSWESCSLKAYKKNGDPTTIGWGDTMYEDGKPIQLTDVITQERADELNLHFCNTINDTINKYCDLPDVLTQNEYDALFSFAYNAGVPSLETNTLLKKLKVNVKDPTIATEFGRWINKGTMFEAGLRRRRSAESNIYFNNVYVTNQGVTL